MRVSRDGRYAAWVDLDGPRRVFGRIAQLVVVDLRSGSSVFHSSEGMGGTFERNPTDRYEDTPPEVRGFDSDHVYWSDAMDLTHRWRLTGGHAQRVRVSALRLPDRVLGAPVTLDRGRVVAGAYGGWLSGSSFYAVTHRFRVVDPTSPPRPGRLVRAWARPGSARPSCGCPTPGSWWCPARRWADRLGTMVR